MPKKKRDRENPLPTESFTLDVNGERRTVEADPEEPLLWVLRDGLGIKGPKFGCGEGDCGACAILVDDEPVRSCLYTAGDFAVEDGAVPTKIETIEGLGQPGNLSPLQQAFLEYTAFGCGYCTPGMIVTATGLLRANPAASRDEIIAYMDENLCRCAAYPNILTAIESVAGSGEES